MPLLLEYERVAKRLVGQIPLAVADIDDILDYLCQAATHHRVFYLWRPFLKDLEDDMVLELAVAEKVSALATEEYLGVRAKRASRKKFLRAMAKVPDTDPDEGDRL